MCMNHKNITEYAQIIGYNHRHEYFITVLHPVPVQLDIMMGFASLWHNRRKTPRGTLPWQHLRTLLKRPLKI